MNNPHQMHPWLCDRIDRALLSAYRAGGFAATRDFRQCPATERWSEQAHDRANYDEAAMWEAVRDCLLNGRLGQP